MHPLHTCRNAFKTHKECVYAVCSLCNTDMKRRSPAKRGGERDDDKECCDHGNLVIYADVRFVNEEYLQKCLSIGEHVPVKCSVCNRWITTNKKLIKQARETMG